MTTVQDKRTVRAPANGAGALLDVRGAACLLGMTEKSVRHLIERGRLPHRKIGRRVVLVKAEIDAWIDTLPGVTVNQVREMQDRRGEA